LFVFSKPIPPLISFSLLATTAQMRTCLSVCNPMPGRFISGRETLGPHLWCKILRACAAYWRRLPSQDSHGRQTDRLFHSQDRRANVPNCVAVYLPMTPEEIQAYEKRPDRISELRQVLAQVKTS